MRLRLGALFAILFAAALGIAQTPDKTDLEQPTRLLAGKLPLDVLQDGHAAPFVGDFYGDGLPHLLVGQYADGKMRIYRNVGTRREPRFDGFEWFKAGGDFARVPVG